MIRIMFVCHGNICRSPMAEFICRKMAAERGLRDQLFFDSSATSTEEINYNGVGNPVYPPAKRELAKNKIPTEEREAVQLKASDYTEYDLFIGMDSANIRNMLRIFSSDPEGKVKKLLSFAGKDADVSDPWYSDRFDIAFSDISEGCIALLEHLIKAKATTSHFTK